MFLQSGTVVAYKTQTLITVDDNPALAGHRGAVIGDGVRQLWTVLR